MAITPLSSSPTHSLALPSIPSLQFHQTLHLHPPISPLPSKLHLDLALNDALTIAAAAQAVVLASAALQAAREALLVAVEIEEVPFYQESGIGLGVRKKRRKRRKGLEYFDLGIEEKKISEEMMASIRSMKFGKYSQQEEAELCFFIKEGSRLEATRRKILESHGHEPTVKQLARATGIMKKSVDKIICNERESRERIIQSYRRLVVSIATSYLGKGLSLKDLIQEGSIGLLRGVEKFKPERGFKLSTYAYWWIKQAISRAIETKSRSVRLPGSKWEVMAKMAEANKVLNRRLRRFPTHDEIAEFLNLQVSTVRLVSERSRPPISLDQVVSDHGHLKLKDIMPGPDESNPEKTVTRKHMKQEVENLLNTLSERESCILRLHFGLDGQAPLSCEEVGRRVKLSRERVRQINGMALLKLQNKCVVDDLKVFIV